MQKASAKSGVAKACQDSTSLLYFLKNYDLKKQEKTLAKQPLSFFVPSNSKKKWHSAYICKKAIAIFSETVFQ